MPARRFGLPDSARENGPVAGGVPRRDESASARNRAPAFPAQRIGIATNRDDARGLQGARERSRALSRLGRGAPAAGGWWQGPAADEPRGGHYQTGFP